ncbi:hypothetical protein [Cohnella silvisoli]|uniref:Uncharacterized protein n=1 Tax=Cohnella silvisoli TaxID=2873699 RepID=A0ABV1L381_9BACL|nr:hypothetical protein [Cohnella silvisoli]MCD9026027.1 hypothetical protein [Cohnella silvisoli]
MPAKYQDTLNRIAVGEEQLNKLQPEDPKRTKIEKNLDKLRADLAALKPESTPDSQTTPGLTQLEPPFIEVDPRPELQQDTEQWTTLLKLAFMKSEELCGVLNGIRCGGTRLKVGRTSNGNRWTLKPDIDSSGRLSWASQADYEEARDKYLMPHMAAVTELLKELAGRYEPIEREIQQEM